MNTKKQVINLIIRLLLILIGIAIILLYIPPIVSLGVLNAGNLFGFAVGGGFIAIGLLLNRIIDFIKDRGKPAIIITGVLLGLCLVFCITFFATLGNVISHSNYTATNEKTVIVLGCQIRGSVPSMTLVQRSDMAVKYLEEHPDSIAIAAGGQGADEDLSEGQCIYNLMTEKGIDPNRIIIEDKSASTDENIANAKRIMDRDKIDYNVAIVTSEYHEYRASLICRKNGLTASSVPAPSSPRGKPTFFTREVFGVWAQWLKQII